MPEKVTNEASQVGGPVGCLRCDFTTRAWHDSGMSLKDQQDVVSDHMNAEHPGWQTDGRPYPEPRTRDSNGNPSEFATREYADRIGMFLLVVALMIVFLVTVLVSIQKAKIRDLQRRVTEIEQQVQSLKPKDGGN